MLQFLGQGIIDCTAPNAALGNKVTLRLEAPNDNSMQALTSTHARRCNTSVRARVQRTF